MVLVPTLIILKKLTIYPETPEESGKCGVIPRFVPQLQS
jgi:hypothetical protein